MMAKVYLSMKPNSDVDSIMLQGHSNLRAPTLNRSYETQESMQGMRYEQLDSRPPNFEGYFGTHQIVQGLGHLNSIDAGREDYFGNQQSLQGLVMRYIVSATAYLHKSLVV